MLQKALQAKWKKIPDGNYRKERRAVDRRTMWINRKDYFFLLLPFKKLIL